MSAIYIHIPYCKSKCGYCSFYSVTDTSAIEHYCASLQKEIVHRAQLRHKKDALSVKPIDTLYIGGGTPSLLSVKLLTQLFKTLRQSFTISPNAEITIEINPESCNSTYIKTCVSLGVNRISMGLQTHDDHLLKDIGRAHTLQDFINAMHVLEKNGMHNVSVDAIAGLPNQSQQSLLDTLECITAYKNVKHVSMYALTVDENTPFAQQAMVTDQDTQADMYEAAVGFLSKKGFLRYETSNFAKVGYESKHNQKYWTGEEYLGFGAGAHSLEGDCRIENVSDITQYLNGAYIADKQPLSIADKIRETIMLSLRRTQGLNLAEMLNATGYNLLQQKKLEIDQLVKEGFLQHSGDCLCVAPDKFYVLNSIILKLI